MAIAKRPTHESATQRSNGCVRSELRCRSGGAEFVGLGFSCFRLSAEKCMNREFLDKIINEALKAWEECGFKDMSLWKTFQEFDNLILQRKTSN